MSEEIVGKCLTGRYPRSSFLLASKLHKNFIEKTENRDAMFSEQFRKTRAGYFDNYLLHRLLLLHSRLSDAHSDPQGVLTL